MIKYIYTYKHTCVYIYIYVFTFVAYLRVALRAKIKLGIHYRGVQWMRGAVDGGHRWSNKQDTHIDF